MRNLRNPLITPIRSIALVLICTLFWFGLNAGAVHAETYTVTKTADTNDGSCDADCSLREAIIAANQDNAADTIVLGPGEYLLTIEGASEDESATGDLDIRGDLTISGSDADTTIIDASGYSANAPERALHIVRPYDIEPYTPTVTIANVTITGGDARNTSNFVYSCCGGGIRSEGTLTIRDSKIVGNYANYGGGLYQAEAVIGDSVFSPPLLIENSLIADNLALSYGGGIATGNSAVVTINDTIIEDNVVRSDRPQQGGGLYGMGQITLSNSTVRNNLLHRLDGDIYGCGVGEGGGIYMFYGLLTMEDSMVIGNSIQSDEPHCTIPTGGGIHAGDLVLLNTQVLSNTASSAGGIYGGNGRIENSVVGYNKAVSHDPNQGNDGVGGGIQLNAASIKHTEIIYNSADTIAGGLYASNNVSITQSLIAHNHAGGIGGGIYGDVTLTQSTVRDNTAQSGGGIAIQNSALAVGSVSNPDAIISQSLIADNVADEKGGGIYISSWLARTQIENSTISGNSAAIGGALHQDQYTESLSGNQFAPETTMINTTVAQNSATTEGSGIYYIQQTSFSFGGVTNIGFLELANTMIADHAGANCAGSASEYRSLGHNLSDDGNCIFIETGDIVKQPPKLGPLQDNGGPTFTHALLDGSPAIDAGDDAVCPAVDQRGTMRPRGSHCDIGAYEYVVNKPILKLSKTELTFIGVAGSTAPDAQTVRVTNDGTADFTWQAAESIAWLSVGTSSGNPPSDVSFTVDTTGLAVGDYSGKVTFTAAGALGSPQEVKVTLQVVDVSEVLQNGDFEQGDTGWQTSSALNQELIRQGAEVPLTAAHSGTWAAVLGRQDGEISELFQQVVLPTGDDLYLHYYSFAHSTETNCTIEIAEVWIGADKVKEHPLCTEQNSTQWEAQIIDLNAYRGQAVELRFKLRNDALSDPSTFLLDDVRLAQDTKTPTLTSNFAVGAPGSYFTLQATDFPPNAEAKIQVNGRQIGTAKTDADGVLQVELETTGLAAGVYAVTVQVNPTASYVLNIADNAPLRARTNSGPLLVVPSDISSNASLYLPAVIR